MTEKPSKPWKPWHRRKRVWCLVIVILLAYFCLVPSRTRISPETTGITGPLTADGKVDYFAAFEKLYIDKLSPPEDNGLRYMIAACGPSILEQVPLVESMPWEEIQTTEKNNWFRTRWLPLCEHMLIDPYQKPMFYDSRPFLYTMATLKRKQKDSDGPDYIVDGKYDEQKHTDSLNDDYSYSHNLFEKLTTSPWKIEDEPEAAKWLKERAPVLDYLGECVRKPNYVCYRWPSGSVIAILLPDVQASREFARDLKVRVAECVGRDDLDGAWQNVMTMKHLASHLKSDSILVTNLVGNAIDGMANESAQVILTYGKPTESQLSQFLRDLNALPQQDFSSLNLTIERMVGYEMLHHLRSEGYKELMKELGQDNQIGVPYLKLLLSLPFDANIAGERLTELCGEFGLRNYIPDQHQGNNPHLRQQYVDRIEESAKNTHKKLNSTQLHRVPLIRTRSRLLAECIFAFTAPSLSSAFGAFTRIEAENEMLKIALALEHEKLVRGEYPARLDALVPTYFLMTPLDPYTGRASFVYKLTPNGEHPFVLYSLGPNAKDDGGLPMEKSGSAMDYDVVFWK